MDFITPEEKKQIEAKLAELISRRPVIIQRIAEARALGDLKENAEYHSARDEQGLNEAEIRRFEARLASAKVVGDVDIPQDMVFLGATVKLAEVDDDGEEGDTDLYRLVGEATGNFDLDVIEVTGNSPMGESLMKARIGETVKVDMPRGTKRFRILEIM
ncbi:MAG: transcription elongation factor GreA [Phycisphaerales bacterium]